MTRWAIAISVWVAAQTNACARRDAPSPSPSPSPPSSSSPQAAPEGTAPSSIDDYFPPDRFQPPRMRSFMTAWYGRSLQELREPSLWQSRSEGTRAIRLLLLRSFRQTVSVRLERSGDAVQLIAVGSGGDDMTILDRPADAALPPVALRRVRPLTLADWDRVESLFAAASFSTMALDNEGGNDGAEWLVERAGGGEYRMITRWSPGRDGPDAAYRRACDALLDLAGPELTAR